MFSRHQHFRPLLLAVGFALGCSIVAGQTPVGARVFEWRTVAALGRNDNAPTTAVTLGGDDVMVAGARSVSVYRCVPGTPPQELATVPLAGSTDFLSSMRASPGRVFLIGGKDNAGANTAVAEVLWDLDHRSIAIRELPPLPEPAISSTPALFGDRLIIATGSPTRRDIRLRSLALGSAPSGWQEFASPEPTLRSAAFATQNDGAGPVLYCFDGITGGAWKYEAAAGVWRQLAGLPATPGSPVCAIPVGPAHIFLWPAARAAAEAGEYPSARGPVAFHTVTETWTAYPNDFHAIVLNGRGSADTRLLTRAANNTISVVDGFPIRSGKGLHGADYAVLILYFVSVVWIGFHFSRGPRSVSSYFRGENQIPAWAAGLSLMATKLSAVTFISLPAKAFATNWTYFLLPFGNLLVALVISRYVIPFYCRLNLTSVYEYLSARYNTSVRLLGSIAFLMLEAARLGVLILVPALVIAVVVQMNIYACIGLIGVVTTVATAVGGVKGVIWTDVLQALLKIGGSAICIAIVWHKTSGIGGLLHHAASEGKLTLVDWSLDLSKATFGILVLNWIGEIKNYTANQTLAQRFIVTKDIKAAQRTVWIGAISVIGTTTLCLALGTALYVFYSAHPDKLSPAMEKPDELLPVFIIREMPVGLAGLIIAAVFSAAIASLNSALNSMSAVVVTDIYRRFFKSADDRNSVRVGKGVIWAVGLFATVVGVLMAQYRIDSLYDRLLEILGLFGGGLGGIFLLGIFTTRATSGGAIVGFVASAAVLLYVKLFTSIHLLSFLAIGMLSCFLIGYLASFLFHGERKDLTGLTVHTQRL